MAMSLDAILGAAFQTRRGHAARSAAALAACGLLFIPSWQKAHIRQTNADFVAMMLNQRAHSDDFIIVNPWFYGQSFERYYRGKALWMTLPPLGEYHRVSPNNGTESGKRFAQRTSPREPLTPLLAGIEQSLKSGHRVWFIGAPALVEKLPSRIQPALLEAPEPVAVAEWSCNDGRCDFKTLRPYSNFTPDWTFQIGYFLYLHTTAGELLPPLTNQPISPFEDFDVAVRAAGQDRRTVLH